MKEKKHRICCLLTVLFLVFCFSRLKGTAVYFQPDSMEYSLGALSLLHGKWFGIQLDQCFYPSRYLPWFSLTFLCPVIKLSGGNFMAGIYGVFLSSVTAVLLIFFLGKKIGGISTGIIAVSILFLCPQFRFYSRCVMTEVPYTAILLGMSYCLFMISHEKKEKWAFLCYILLTAWAGSIRSSAYPMAVVPLFLLFQTERHLRKRIFLFLSAVIPSLIVVFAGMYWNKITFGSFFRNGYQYWCPVPYDYPNLTFSLSCLPKNFLNMWSLTYTWVALLESCVIFYVMYLLKQGKIFFESPIRKNDFILQSIFAFFQIMVLFVLYLPYCFSIPDRFFMPAAIVLILPSLTALHILKISHPVRNGLTAILICSVILTAFFKDNDIDYTGNLDKYLFILDKTLPADASLVTVCDCALASYKFCTTPDRHIIPAIRSQEYAGKIIAPEHQGKLDPPPASPTDHLTPALLKKKDCILPFPFVFLENQEKTADYVRKHCVFIGESDFRHLRKHLASFLPDLYAVEVRTKPFRIYQLVLPQKQ